jgi:formate dehydrogenase assembly factor FdhD
MTTQRFSPLAVLAILDAASDNYISSIDGFVEVRIYGDTAEVDLSSNEPLEDQEHVVTDRFRVTVERIEPERAVSGQTKCGGCGKTVAIRKDGALWHHRSLEREYPGSPWRKVCARSGWDADRAVEGGA